MSATEHELNDNCWCGPRDIPVERDDGSIGWVTVHNDTPRAEPSAVKHRETSRLLGLTCANGPIYATYRDRAGQWTACVPSSKYATGSEQRVPGSIMASQVGSSPPRPSNRSASSYAAPKSSCHQTTDFSTLVAATR